MPSSWFSFPLKDWRKSVDYVQSGARTLPDQQLVSELKELRDLCQSATDDLAARLIYRVYEEEQARRLDPCRAFDTQLDAALSRLERATSPEDRSLVTGIGKKLNEIGGADALRAAYQRMTFNRKSAPLREHILQNRWNGLGQWRDAA